MTIAVTFRCGHRGTVSTTTGGAPVCAECGETGIARSHAPAPRFTGYCTGPSATFKALEPIAVRVGLKDDQHG